jgi:hypothetical protein
MCYHLVIKRQAIQLRLPKSLHERLREQADREEVSMNSLLLALIAGAVGYELTDPPTKRRSPRTEDQSAGGETTQQALGGNDEQQEHSS